MKAVVWKGREAVAVEEVDDPRIEEPTDAIVRVTSTAICGSDLHLYGPLWPVMRRGDILGHEAMGIVEEVGRAVSHVTPGDRVVIPFNISCGKCSYCTRGLFAQCAATRPTTAASKVNLLRRGKGASLYGYTHMYGAVPGGQAQFLRVPHADFGPIPVPTGGRDERFLLLSDVLPTGFQAVEYAEVAPGSTVAVFGLGPIGLMACRFALRRGAGRVLGLDRVPERLAMADRWGVETIDTAAVDHPHDVILDLTAGEGCDHVIDAVGMEASGSPLDRVLAASKLQFDRLNGLKSALRVVRRGGVLSIVGVYGGPFPLFPLGDLFDLGITIRLGQAHVKRWTDSLLPLLIEDDDVLGVEELITHRFPLELAPVAYSWFRHKQEGCVKPVLDPWASLPAE